MQNISIRLETKEDYRETEIVVREAFWDIYQPGCDEHLILHKLRKTPAFIQELDFVACDKDKIVGNIVYSKAKIKNHKNEEFTVLCLGPLSVLPSYQGKGIGSLLVKESILKAKSLGYKAVLLYGEPNYYGRFGFENAKKYNIQTSTGENFDEFLVLELYKNSLKGINGKYFYDLAFEVDQNELEIFEKEFPYKEKSHTNTV